MEKLTLNKFRALYSDDDACLDRIFQLRFSGLVCPICDSTKTYSRVKDRRCYQCPDCSNQIYPTKDTVFQKTTTPLTSWFYLIYLQTVTRNGVSAKEIERTFDVCYKTALRMCHQVKKLMANRSVEPLTGFVELDESYIGGLLKNKHNHVRAENVNKRDKLGNKETVFAMIQRGGEVRATHISTNNHENIIPIVEKNVEIYSTVITDTANLYRALDNVYFHHTVNHSKDEYVRLHFHTNTIEGFFSQLKRTIRGTHLHVSPKHLQKYVDEVAFRYCHRNNQAEMFETILQNVCLAS